MSIVAPFPLPSFLFCSILSRFVLAGGAGPPSQQVQAFVQRGLGKDTTAWEGMMGQHTQQLLTRGQERFRSGRGAQRVGPREKEKHKGHARSPGGAVTAAGLKGRAPAALGRWEPGRAGSYPSINGKLFRRAGVGLWLCAKTLMRTTSGLALTSRAANEAGSWKR